MGILILIGIKTGCIYSEPPIRDTPKKDKPSIQQRISQKYSSIDTLCRKSPLKEDNL